MDKNIAITETYLSSVFKLDNQSKRLTLNAIKKLSENPRSPSLSIHSIDRTRCDAKFRSARINDDLRVIFFTQGDIYTLLYVDHHDDAYNWCEGKYIQTTDFGAEYLYDEEVSITTDTFEDKTDYLHVSYERPLLEKAEIKEKHLSKLGIPEIHSKNLLKLNSEDNFINYVAIFPAEIQEALLDLATGTKNFDCVYNELTDDEFDKNTQDPIKQKDTKRRFYVTQSMEELQLLMENDDFEKWTVFLHPNQERLVKKDFRGPALIEGGPGTGKTIVGIHRAVYLAENVYKAEDNKKILICTFSKKLSKTISEKVDKLINQHGVKNNIDVLGVDSFILQMLQRTYGQVPQVKPLAFTNLIDKLYDTLKPKGSREFYINEFHEVIEKHNIKTLEEYLDVDRLGTGMPLARSGRILAWQFIKTLLDEKQNNQIYTFIDRAYLLLNGLQTGEIIPQYDSIIIDEAQDLEAVKLKALCKCVKSEANNVFILSDLNQRIFKLTSWKKDSEINIVGRTHYLSVNYRTTKQINDYAQYQFVNSEMTTTHIREYKSVVNGLDPIIEEFKSESEQYKFIVNKINELVGQGYKTHQICIVCPSKEECKQIESVLTFSNIKSMLLFNDIAPYVGSEICICSINGVKGLEFSVVIIYNYNNIGKGRLKDIKSAQVRNNYTKLIECEKYVAATRARDELIITYLEDGEKE